MPSSLERTGVVMYTLMRTNIGPCIPIKVMLCFFYIYILYLYIIPSLLCNSHDNFLCNSYEYLCFVDYVIFRAA